MILEEETYEKFGYYPKDLKPKSHKKILAACDECGKIRELNKHNYSSLCKSCAERGKRNHLYGKHHTEVARKKMSASRKGQRNHFYGKHHTDETKQKIRDANEKYWNIERRQKVSEERRGEKSPWYGKHHTEETRQKMREARKKQKLPKHHTKPERIFEQICKKNDLPFKYTGDGAFWIGKKPAINPDFIECNGKKIAIEIFSYWHDPLKRHCKVRYSATFKGRKKALKKHKWKLVVFWQEDLERDDAEQFVLSELKKYKVL